MDFDELAADIAVEARHALSLSEEVKGLDKRIARLYEQVDPAGIVRSAPGSVPWAHPRSPDASAPPPGSPT